jgi:LysM repeat protein
MSNRDNQTKFNQYGMIILLIVIIGGMAACRTRPVPGSVTPDVDSSVPEPADTPAPEQSNTPVSYPEPGDTEPFSPTPTIISDTGAEPVVDTPIPQATVPAEATPVATEPSPTSETPTPLEGDEETPSPTATSSPPSGCTPGSTVQHVVGQREWLIQIARCYGTSYEAIRANNRLPNPNLIQPGTLLNIPAIGSTGSIIGPPCVIPYTVQPGDTWESLAQQFGTTVAIMQRANPGNLIAGNQIWVPRSN